MILLLKAMITKANYWCFFLIGFLAYKVIGITAVPLTILAVCLALILDRAKGKSDQTTKTGGDTLESLE